MEIPTTKNGKPMYTIVRDGNGQEYKIVNFDNEEMVPRSGIKIVQALKKTSRHQPSSSTRLERDAITGIIFGIPAGLNEITKALRFQLIEIKDIRHFDLSVQQDRMEWAVISRAKFLRESPFVKGKPTHFLYDVDREAKSTIERVNDRESAYQTIKSLSELQLLDMARNVGGINTKNTSSLLIKASLFDFVDSKDAGKGAKAFNKIWSMSNREVLTIFNRCKAVGLVSFDTNNGYLWKKSYPLGPNEASSLETMNSNHSLLMAMDQESRSMDVEFSQYASTDEKEAITAKPVIRNTGDADNELSETLARAKAKEAELDRILSKAKIVESIPMDKTPVENFGSDEMTPDKILDLQTKAHSLGMKHAFVTKDMSKVTAFIAEKEKK